ncbi:tryptophan 7-halogenase [Colwellia sp. 75C3]|uniref:tryptophan 7-halogenase n=1 Tax=Colwellia sp. 75C3 TaxID=888425 RepID=UPI0012FF07E5
MSANGRIFRQDNKLFTETSWLAVMHGQGLIPSGYHPLVDVFLEDEVERRVQHIT